MEIRGALKRATQQRALPLQVFVNSINPIFDQLFVPWTGHWLGPSTSNTEQRGRRFRFLTVAEEITRTSQVTEHPSHLHKLSRALR